MALMLAEGNQGNLERYIRVSPMEVTKRGAG